MKRQRKRRKALSKVHWIYALVSFMCISIFFVLIPASIRDHIASLILAGVIVPSINKGIHYINGKDKEKMNFTTIYIYY